MIHFIDQCTTWLAFLYKGLFMSFCCCMIWRVRENLCDIIVFFWLEIHSFNITINIYRQDRPDGLS